MGDPANIHIESVTVEYTDVIEKFTEKKIQDRYHRLLESAQNFVRGMGYQDHVFCNETILMHAVLEYFSDIMRIKDFHEIERVNDIKILAYETSWLLKRKPLQIKDSNDQKYTFCNEQFAFWQITLWLRKGEEENGLEAFKNNDGELAFFTNSLFYHLKYRNYDPQTLELVLVSFIAGRKYQQFMNVTKR